MFQMSQAEGQKSFKNPWRAEKDRGADWDESPVCQITISHLLSRIRKKSGDGEGVSHFR